LKRSDNYAKNKTLALPSPLMGEDKGEGDLKVIERLQQPGWKRGDTVFYQQEYGLSINL